MFFIWKTGKTDYKFDAEYIGRYPTIVEYLSTIVGVIGDTLGQKI